MGIWGWFLVLWWLMGLPGDIQYFGIPLSIVEMVPERVVAVLHLDIEFQLYNVVYLSRLSIPHV